MGRGDVLLRRLGHRSGGVPDNRRGDELHLLLLQLQAGPGRLQGSSGQRGRGTPTAQDRPADLPDRRHCRCRQVAIVPSQNPNAFATGRNPQNATVAATEGILQLLNDDELTGVLAHELAHVRNRDMLVMTVSATLAGAISFAARSFLWGSMFGGGNRDSGNYIVLLIVAITAPLAAMLVQLAVSRSREYLADSEGAMMIGRPMALANALRKLEVGNKARPMQMGNPSHASLFIVNPFTRGGLAALFSTHPPMAERIRRLEEMAGGMRR